MSVARYDFTIEQGADFSRRLVLSNAGVAIDITGWTFAAQIRKNYSSADIVASFTTAKSDPVNGVIDFSLTHDQTSAIPVKPAQNADKILTEYAFDLEATRGDGIVIRLLEGVASVSPEVTR